MLSKYKLKQQVVALITAAAVFLCMMPLSDISAQAEDSAEDSLKTVTPTETHPEGITIDLFDYWLDDEDKPDNLNANDYSAEIHGDTYDKLGINKGHTLKFGQNISDTSNDSINQWTHSATPRTGIVQDTLEGGYPKLAETYNGEPLAYLFNENDAFSEDAEKVEGKRAYMNVDGLLQQNEEGYYYYNSQDNFASFDTKENTFTLYNTWGVKAAGGSHNGQFFPFDTDEEVFKEGTTTSLINSKNEVLNHYFGVHMKTRFQQPKNGVSPADGATPVTFSFSGDDDVWIFIDGVLVADLGGIHDALSVEINFKTGAIEVNGYNNNGQNIYTSTSTIKEKMEYVGITSGFKNNTFADETYHTLDFFYLERGNVDSNMNMQFNLTIPPESTLTKVDQDGEAIENAAFALYEATKNDYTDEYTKNESAAPIAKGTTDDEGAFTFLNTDGAIMSLDDLTGAYYILEETKTPDGYRSYDEIWLRKEALGDTGKYVLLSSNQWDSGAYAMPTVRTIATTTVGTDGSRSVVGENNQNYPIIDGSETQVGLVFAVALHGDKASLGTDLNLDNLHAIYGDPIEGWKTSQETGLDGVLEAIEAGGIYLFGFDSANRYAVDIENIPGNIQSYQWVNNNNYEYTIGYYYANVDSVDKLDDTTVIEKIDSDAFTRDFAVKLYAANIENRLIVQKTDEDGNGLEGATFELYNKKDVEDKIKDGKLTSDALSNINSVMKCETEANFEISEDNFIQGAAAMTGIREGAYYLVETKAPEGYQLDATPIEVIVDNQGVHVNAGNADDAVSVQLGVGKLVKSMAQFAVDDGIDASLHDITATLQTTEKYPLENGGIWQNANPNKSMALSYSADATILEYGPAETGGSVSLNYDSDWGRLNIQQTAPKQGATLPNGSPVTILGAQSLNNLYSTTTIVTVKNEPEDNPNDPDTPVTPEPDDPDTPVTPPSDPDDPDTPDLNTVDHYSYIVGYPEDYRTGEPTDDEELWPVKPQGNITRAEVATIFYRLLTDEARAENWTQDNSFTDVDKGDWFNTPVSTLSAMGIIGGYEDGSFQPNASITRAEFAAIAVRFFEEKSVDYDMGSFIDIEGDEWYADAIQAAKEYGIIGGYPDGSFQPNDVITRAEACSIVNRTLKRIPEKEHLLPESLMRVWPDNADVDAWFYEDMQEATSSHEYEWIVYQNETVENWTGDREEIDWDEVERELCALHGVPYEE